MRLPLASAALAAAAAATMLSGLAPARGEADAPVPRVKPLPAAPGEETLSASGQFLIHGPDAVDRSRLATLLEGIRAEFTRLIDREQAPINASIVPKLRQDADDDQGTIDVWIRGDATAPVTTRIYRIDGAPRYTMGVVISHAGVSGTPQFRRAVIRLLLAERIVRRHLDVDLSGREDVLPAWLDEGVPAALEHVRVNQADARFAAIYRAGDVMPLSEILTARPASMTEGQREVFRASACGLVLALLDQPEGPDRFRGYLEGIATATEGSQMQLVRKFPGLALSRHSLEKWWALQVAQLAQPTVFDVLSPADSESALARALVVHYRPPPPGAEGSKGIRRWLKKVIPGGGKPEEATVPAAAPVELEPERTFTLDQFETFGKLPGIDKALAANQAALTGLQLRIFPLHRPLLDGYQEVVAKIARGKTKGLAERLGELDASRKTLFADLSAAEEYLDWFEATQRARSTGRYEQLFRRLDEMERKSATPRTDPISRYLDEIDAEYR